MAVHTLVISIVTPNGTEPKPVVTLCWPNGDVMRHTLHEHDWGNDTWDWRGGRLPDSLARRLRDTYDLTAMHGSRSAYVSPRDVGTGTNEQGRLMVYELDYEV